MDGNTDILIIGGGMAMFATIDADTSYRVLLGSLFVMGMGMGATMMPIMTSALQTLKAHDVARGSTLMNIVQQIASSVGAAVMSVVLTNEVLASQFAGAAIASQNDPSILTKVPAPAIAQGLVDAAHAFGTTFTVALVLILVTFVPALMLPRSRRVTLGHGHGHGHGEGEPDVPVLMA